MIQTLGASAFSVCGLALMLLLAPLGTMVLVGPLALYIYFPHGCRVILAWMYGTRSIVLAAPAAAAEVYVLSHFESLLPTSPLLIIAFLLVPSLCFLLAALFGYERRLDRAHRTNWRDIALIGAASAAVNATAITFANGWNGAVWAIWFAGNVLGVIGILVVLMLGFRLMRQSRPPWL